MVDSLGGVTAALRLFPEDATAFTTLGVGVLSDAISAKVTEERNGAYELTVEYPVDGAHFADVSLGSIIACKPSPYATHAQPFRVYSITTPMSGKVTIDAQHISYDLNAYTVKPFKASEVGAAMGGLKSSIVGECPFSFETDKATKAAFALEVPQSVRATLGGVDGSILDTYAGEYEWDGLTVRLLAHRGEDRGVTVEYGKNLTDLKQEQNNAAVYTHVYPFWHSDEAGTVTLDSPVSTGITGRERTLTLDLSSDDSLRTEGDAAPTQAQLLAACNAYIKAHELTRPKVSITVDFIELAKSEQYAGTAPLERVWLCDTVTVRFPKLGVDATAEVIKGTYDVLLDRWDKVELGDAKSTLSSTIAGMPAAIAKEAERYRSVTKTAVEAATRALTGITGGHVVIWNSATHLPDAPDEILIMDTDSIETAVNVWRYNAAGWGHSSTGYAGTYTMAAYVGDSSHAGGIVADAITSGILKAGRIEDSTGQNYWDLDSGTLVLNHGTLTTDRIKTSDGESYGIIGKDVNGKSGMSLVDETGEFFKAAAARLSTDNEETTGAILSSLSKTFLYTSISGRFTSIFAPTQDVDSGTTLTYPMVYVSPELLIAGINDTHFIQITDENFLLRIGNSGMRLSKSDGASQWIPQRWS